VARPVVQQLLAQLLCTRDPQRGLIVFGARGPRQQVFASVAQLRPARQRAARLEVGGHGWRRNVAFVDAESQPPTLQVSRSLRRRLVAAGVKATGKGSPSTSTRPTRRTPSRHAEPRAQPLHGVVRDALALLLGG
jgi:hypothetical protein